MDVSETCATCGGLALPSGTLYDRARLLSGAAYCPRCLLDVSFDCRRCQRPLRLEDFDQGRAMVILGRKYCDHCLEEEVHKQRNSESRESAPPLDESGKKWKAHRAHPRVVPPQECSIAVSRPGFLGFLGGDVLRLWVDVSQGGLRAILRGKYAVGDRLRGTMTHVPKKLKLGFQGIVRYVKTSDRFPESRVVGIQFDHPSQELQAFIRDALGAGLSATPTPRRKPPTQFPSTRAG